MNSAAALATPDTITRRTMRGNEHLRIRAAHIPHQIAFHRFEAMIYGQMREVAPGYDGGQWRFHALSNGGWFMAPMDQKTLTLRDCMGQAITMSAEAAGLAITIFVLNLQMWDLHGQHRMTECNAAAEHYHALLAYAEQLPEHGQILQVLD